jgi:hypothetical protein
MTTTAKPTLLDKLFSREKGRERSAEDAYQAVVAEVADARELKPERVEEVLRAASKDVEALRRDVERLTERRRLRGVYESGLRAVTEQSKIEAQIKVAGERFAQAMEQVRRQHEATVAPLRSEAVRLDAVAAAGRMAEARLRDAATLTADTAAELAELEQRLASARERETAAAKAAHAARVQMEEADRKKNLKEPWGHPRGLDAQQELTRRADAAAKEYDALSPVAAEARQEVEALVRELESRRSAAELAAF